MLMFSLYDVKAEAYTPPFCFETVGLAERAVVSQVRTGQGEVASFPDQFLLFKLGEFDSKTGEIVGYPEPGMGVPVSQILNAYKEGR